LPKITWRMSAVACMSTAMALAPAAASAAAQAPGDNGTVKVHRSTTPAGDPRNEPKVCSFYLVGFQFDPAQEVSWYIKSWPPTAGGERRTVLTGTLTLGADGHGRTNDLSLPDGHYKLFWNFEGENGFAKQKVFWVDCPAPSGTPTPTPPATPTPTPSGPGGGHQQPPGKPSTSSPTPSPTRSTPSVSESPQTTMPPHQNAGGEGGGGGLPVTGFTGALLAGIGLALVLGGSAAVVLSRRARGTSS
jgi:hypothetical protein